MASMKRPRLRAVQAQPGSTLELTFINGQHFTLDMSEDLKTYPGLKPLTKAKAFMGAILGDGGWTVEWPELDIQIGADTLFLDALAQAAPDENTRLFIRWRLRHRMTLDQAAEALGVSARSISRYSSGREAVPRTLALACLGWEALEHPHAA
jgi:DNA-binding XRE family transcriptional regulator